MIAKVRNNPNNAGQSTSDGFQSRPFDDSSEEDDSDFTEEQISPGATTRSLVKANVPDSDDEDEFYDAGGGTPGEMPKEQKWRSWASENYKKFPFIEYAKNHFWPEKRGIFSSRTFKQDIIWSKSPIKKSLLRLDEEHEQNDAVRAFKCILKY
eukprot:UN04149